MHAQCTGETQGSRNQAFPARWFDGLCRALPGAEFLLASLASTKFTAPRRLTRVTPSPGLDRSNDGQDHTVSPYAGHPASPRGSAGHGRRPSSRSAPCSRGSSRPARKKPPLTPPASTATRPAFVTTYDRPFRGLGWPTHTTNPNFGKVEYFRKRGLTAVPAGLPDEAGQELFPRHRRWRAASRSVTARLGRHRRLAQEAACHPPINASDLPFRSLPAPALAASD